MSDLSYEEQQMVSGFLIRVHCDPDALDDVMEEIEVALDVYHTCGWGVGLRKDAFIQYFVFSYRNGAYDIEDKETFFTSMEKKELCEAIAENKNVTRVELGDDVDLRELFSSAFSRKQEFRCPNTAP